MGQRTYPRVHLSKIEHWVQVLGTYALPLIEISERKLQERLEKRTLPAHIVERIHAWKTGADIHDSDELEYKYFLECIGAIYGRKATKTDLNVPLFDVLTLKDLRIQRLGAVKMYFLSRLGARLQQALERGQRGVYEALLFWLIIRSERFDPLIQRLIEDPRTYKEGLKDDYIPSNDAISRTVTLSWLQSLSLEHDGSLDTSLLARLMLYAVILEINERCPLKDFVEILARKISERLSVAEAAIDFTLIIDFLYVNSPDGIVDGFPSGRGHLGLPSNPRVQMLEFKRPIPLDIVRSKSAARCVWALRHLRGEG